MTSMFAFGLPKAGESVALILRAADRKKTVQMVIIASLFAPEFGEVPNHGSDLRLHAVLIEIAA